MNGIVSTSGSFKSEAERQAFFAAVPPANAAVPSLPDAQRAQRALLAVWCQDAIYAGFVSSALGAPHTYPAKDRDQNNLNASVTASLLPGLPADWVTPFPCMDVNGMWAHAPHTAAQIQQVGLDAKAAIVACILKNQALVQQIMAVQDDSPAGIEQVRGIVW